VSASAFGLNHDARRDANDNESDDSDEGAGGVSQSGGSLDD